MFRRLSICLVLSFLAVGVAFAQVNIKAAAQNTWMVSGSMGFSYFLGNGQGETDSPTEGLELTLTPRVLWYPVDGLGVGGEASLDWYTNSYTTTDLGIGPRVAFYLRNPERRYPSGCCLTPCVGPNGWWMPFLGASVLYQMRDSGNGDANGFRARAGVGVSPVIGTKGTMPVELGFEYQSMKQGDYDPTTSSKIYLEAGFGAFLWK